MSAVTTSDNSASTQLHVVEDCRGVLQVYSDGSIFRSDKPSFHVPVHDDGSVIWKDVVFDTTHNLQLRLYKPASVVKNKLPIFYYFHGGGFCIGSRTWPHCQSYCIRLSLELQAVIVSPDYRLAPENRLPAAIEDGVVAVQWLQAQALSKQADAWLTDVSDFSSVFISGDSAGGNIAHHVATQVGIGSLKLEPVRIRGHVLLAPFFGGTVQRRSEAEGSKDALLNLELINRFWRLSLPAGETTDSNYVNPFGPSSLSLERISFDPILVIMGEKDLLKDRAKMYATKLKEWGKKVDYVEFAGQQHGFFTLTPDSKAANELMVILKRCVHQNSA